MARYQIRFPIVSRAQMLYEFGPFQLNLSAQELLRDGGVLPLAQPSFQMLVHLVQRHGEAVSRAELARLAWPDTDVDGGYLAMQVSALKRLLGQHLEGADYIELLDQQRYRFAAPALLISQTESAARDSLGLTRLHGSAIAQSRRLIDVRMSLVGGRYEILSLLGSGGMGEVYLAHDSQLGRKVAIKLLPENYTENAQWLRRFVLEARAASALNHPNIITIHDIGTVDGLHYIASEHIEGGTLRAHLVGGRLGVAAALNIAIQLCSALSAAHEAGIVHRDIKPENVMVRPDGYIKLLDFGLAKPLRVSAIPGSQPQTDPGAVMGTATYMSPEQTRGLAVDARSDVFSLGVLLYEMLTGVAPFQGATEGDVIVAILDRQPLPLTQLLSSVPEELQRIVSKALRKDREQRYQSVEQMQLALKAVQQEVELRARYGDSVPSFSAESGSVATIQRHLETTPLAAPPDIPEVHYARSGEVNIAYQVIGDAPLDLVFVMGWVSHLESFWSEPSFARFLRRLASFARVILFDKRGTGLSDRVPIDQLPTLEQRMDDVRSVMEAVGSARAVLCGVSEGGPMCSLFAATYPEKTIALVMMGSYARRLRAADYPWGPTEAERDAFLELIRNQWGGPVGIDARAPSMAHDPAFRSWWAAYLRRGASPAAAVALTRMNSEIDVRRILPTVRVPTLVIHRRDDICLRVEEGRYLAEHIPGAKFVELAGNDHLPFVGAQDEILDEIEEFLTGVRHASAFDRVLATVLSIQIGPSTRADVPSVAAMSEQLAMHQSFLRKEVELFKGRTVEFTGQQLLATFDGPARAIRAACAIRGAAGRLRIALSAGLHTGECDVMGDHLGGIAVHIAQQIARAAGRDEILVSSTVKDLVAGSGIAFVERGWHALNDELGDWRLYAVGS